MGCLMSTEEGLLDSAINNELSAALRDDYTMRKIVLLGAGGSGKSTFFKQLRSIHGNGYSDRERKPFKKHVFNQIIQEMKCMISFAQELFEENPIQYAQFKLSDDVIEHAQYVQTLRDDTRFTHHIGNVMDALWHDPAINHVFEQRARFALTDSTGTFLDDIHRVSSEHYIPTYEELLLCRQRSVGIDDKIFKINGNPFRIFDVGGQRAERRKWIHCFEHVTAIIYVVSLSGYNETMFEDDTDNVMHDSLRLFEKTCNNEWFKETPVILFLNKSDLFRTKIESVPLSCCFPDYKGANTYEASIAEIEKQFKERNKQSTRAMYTHVTCAVDDENVKTVFNDVHSVLSTKLLIHLM